jgi:hypothetical protein
MIKTANYLIQSFWITLVFSSGCNDSNSFTDGREYYHFNGGYQIIEKDSIGRIKAVHTINHGKNDSLVIRLYDNGQIGRIERFEKKVSQGFTTAFFESGRIDAHSQYQGGEKYLWSKWYDKKGRIRKMEFHIPIDGDSELGQLLSYDTLGSVEINYSQYVNLSFRDDKAVIQYFDPSIYKEYSLIFLDENYNIDSIGYSLEPFQTELSLESVPSNTKYGCVVVAIDTLGRRFYDYRPFEWKEQNHNSLND